MNNNFDIKEELVKIEKEIEDKKHTLNKHILARKVFKRIHYILIFLLILDFIYLIFLHPKIFNRDVGDFKAVDVNIFTCLVIFVTSFGTFRTMANEIIKNSKSSVLQAEEKKNLVILTANNSGSEIKFNSMLKSNQNQLNEMNVKYYETNLSQTKSIYFIGIIMIVIGIGIIIFSLYRANDFEENSGIFLTVGCIAGILVDFVGAIFVQIHSKVVQSSLQFHSKLTKMNIILLANAIASQIENDSLREETFSVMAKNTYASREVIDVKDED